MRQSKIQYNPALTVKENAKRNGVSEAAVRYYIKVNYIDRNFERKQNIIEDCRKYLKKHPKATRTELQQKTGHSLSTIRIFWEYISSEKELMNFDGEKAKKHQQIKESELKWQISILSKIPTDVIKQYLSTRLEEQKLLEKVAFIRQQIETYIEKEHRNSEKLRKNPAFYPVLTKKDLLNFDWNHYDASKYICVAFRSKDDKWKDMWVPFGNMNNGFPFKIAGIEYPTSEQAYICGVFSNDTPEHKDLQEKCNKARSGYEAKRMIRLKNKEQERTDWREFKIDWMLFCVWQKIQQNQVFKDLLLAIPEGTTIIEDNSFKAGDVDKYWGCFNPDRREFGKLARKYAKSFNLKSKKATKDAENALLWDFCNYGVFEGTNEMGRILTYLKDCLHNGTEPEIDYKLLQSKNIYLLGEILDFDNTTHTESESPSPITTNALKKAKATSTSSKSKKIIETSTLVPQQEPSERVYGIIGSVIGDIVGSRLELVKTFPKYNFKFYGSSNMFTDDTIMTVAIADALLHQKGFQETMLEWGHKYPNGGWGGSFRKWLQSDNPVPYNSKGNGCGMRISPVGFYGDTLEEVLDLATKATMPTHGSVEGLKGAKAIASAIFLARQQKPKNEIKKYIEDNFGYNLNRTKEEIISMVKGFEKGMGELAENSVPVAIIAFLNSNDFEDSIRIAMTYGGDTDTIGAMAGGISAAYYGVPINIIQEAIKYLSQDILDVINEFDKTSFVSPRITPSDTHEWNTDCVVVYGSSVNEGENGEDGSYDVHNIRNRHKIEGYSIRTIGADFEDTKKDIETFVQYVEEHPQKTFLVKRVGIQKANIPIGRIAPLFEPLKDTTNVFLPIEFRQYFENDN